MDTLLEKTGRARSPLSFYRSFMFKLLLFTTFISVGIFVPIVVFYFISVANITDTQQYAFIIAVLVTVVVDMTISFFWDGFLLKPFYVYARRLHKKKEISEDLKITVRERINSLPILRSYGIIAQWLAGLLALSIIVPIMSGITFDQLLHAWVSGSIAIIAAYVLYVLVTTRILDSFIKSGIFDSTLHTVSIKTRTVFGSLIPSISAALIAVGVLLELAMTVTAIKIAHNHVLDLYSENLVITSKQIDAQLATLFAESKQTPAMLARTGRVAFGIQKKIAAIDTIDNYSIALYSPRGILLYHPDMKSFQNLNINDYGWGRDMLNQPGTVVTYSHDDTEMMGILTRNNTYGFISVTSVLKSHVNSYSASLAVWMIFTGFFWLLLASFMISRYVKRMIYPIRECHTALGKIAHGDFRSELQNYTGDEIGMLASSINLLIEKIRQVVKDGIQVSFELANSSKELSTSTMSVSENAQSEAVSIEQITAAIEEISAGMGNISNSTDEQFSNLKMLNDRMQELSDIILNIGNNIKDTVNITETIKTLSSSGNESLHHMNDTMAKIINSSKNMIGVVNIINGISEQVNLLSLNASIEAARAGDAGRGFAVVSDEISKLAGQTASSIKQIDTLIKENKSLVESGFSQITEATTVLQNILSGVSTIADKMIFISQMISGQLETNKTVLSQVTTTRSRAEQIKSSTEEQKLATSEISKSVSNMNSITQTYASGSEEMASTAESIASMSEHLKHTMEFFKV